MRGCLTPKIQQIAVKELGREISTIELRLMAYVTYASMNSRTIGPREVNAPEKALIKEWNKSEWCNITRRIEDFRMSNAFWQTMSQILYLAYVMYNTPEANKTTIMGTS